MTDPAAPSTEGHAAELAAALLARIPAGAVPLKAVGWRGIAWVLDGVAMRTGVAAAALAIGPGGPTFASHYVILQGATGLPGSPGTGGDWRLVTRGVSSLLRFLAKPPIADGGPPPPFAAAEAEAFALRVPARSLLAINRLGIPDGATVAWATGAGDEAANLAFAAAHPWIMPLALEDVDARDARLDIACGMPADAAAAALIAHPYPPESATSDMVARLRGLAWRDTFALDPAGLRDRVRACCRLPAGYWPPCAEGTPADSDPQQAMLAFVHAAPQVQALATFSDREPTGILGPVRDFARYAETLSARAGHELSKADMCGEWASFAVEGPMSQVADMAAAFANDILRPAQIRSGLPAPRDPKIRLNVDAWDPAGAPAAALRLLLGAKTLPALCELSRRWHARTDAIARIVASAEGAEPPEASRVIPDLDLGEGVFATQVTTTLGLLDEGAPEADAAGAAGLNHCVASYAGDVATGDSIILSVRRAVAGGYERLSTAELRPRHGLRRAVVVQHRGLGNADPDPRVDAALHVAVSALDGMLDLPEAPDEEPFDPAAAIAAPGTWERVRDAWAFALPRPLRGAGVGEILDAAGLGPLASGAGAGHHQPREHAQPTQAH